MAGASGVGKRQRTRSLSEGLDRIAEERRRKYERLPKTDWQSVNWEGVEKVLSGMKRIESKELIRDLLLLVRAAANGEIKAT